MSIMSNARLIFQCRLLGGRYFFICSWIACRQLLFIANAGEKKIPVLLLHQKPFLRLICRTDLAFYFT